MHVHGLRNSIYHSSPFKKIWNQNKQNKSSRTDELTTAILWVFICTSLIHIVQCILSFIKHILCHYCFPDCSQFQFCCFFQKEKAKQVIHNILHVYTLKQLQYSTVNRCHKHSAGYCNSCIEMIFMDLSSYYQCPPSLISFYIFINKISHVWFGLRGWNRICWPFFIFAG